MYDIGYDLEVRLCVPVTMHQTTGGIATTLDGNFCTSTHEKTQKGHESLKKTIANCI